MRWNSFAGTTIVPTLARLILAMAFIPVGLHKIAGNAEFTAKQAQTLRNEYGVSLTPIVAEPAAYIQEEPDPIDQKPPAGNLPPDDEDADQRTGNTAAGGQTDGQPPADADEPAALPDTNDADADGQRERIEIPDVDDTRRYRGQPLHHLTLMLHDQGMFRPKLMAWLVALTEFGGGILILIGLFSRVWGLGLAVVMGAAFYMTSMAQYFEIGPFEVASGTEHLQLYVKVFTQLGLALAALAVFLVGPGPLSLDRLIFRPRKPEESFENVAPRRADAAPRE